MYERTPDGSVVGESAAVHARKQARAVRKSATAGADGVIVDLEDAVAPQSKEAERTAALDDLQQPVEASGFLRLNGLDTPEGMKDLAALHCAGVWPDIVLLPKVESGAATALLAKQLDRAPGVSIVALVESARGVESAFEIAASTGRLVGVALGASDLCGWSPAAPCAISATAST
jgi:citrate lyase beta subunit